MKKIFLIIIIALVFLTGCNKRKPPVKGVIFLSSSPIDAGFTPDKREDIFVAGKKVNFVVIAKTPFKSETLRIQILKVIPSIEMAQGRDIEVDPSAYYAVDSFCIYKEGSYVIRIFGVNGFENPIAQEYF